MLAGIFMQGCCAPQIGRADTTADASSVQAVFLGRLRDLALAGQLFDTQVTAATLGFSFEESAREVPLPFPDCRDGTKATTQVTTVSVSDNSWFHTLPSGAGHISIPAFMINLAAVSGDPTFDYRIFHSLQCTESRRLRDKTEAVLSFGGLPAFTCLTPANIQAALPKAVLVQATDGVFMVELQGRQGDDSGTMLTFHFRAGASCALGAEVKQDQETGLRYRRALYRYSKCREPSDRDFCSTHPNIGWSNSEAIDQMNLQADERCGTVDSLYRQEPSSGMPPPPIERRVGSGPCAASTQGKAASSSVIY
ncbi:MAG TPA: hypothetical protein VGI23_27310 [Steroidobacteraceae bacterium]